MAHDSVTEEFRTRALNGDGQFAIAFAIMRLREDLCFGDGSGDRITGTLEKLAMSVTDIAEHLARDE